MVCLIQAQISDTPALQGVRLPTPLQTRWDPEDALVVFVGRLNWREQAQRTGSD